MLVLGTAFAIIIAKHLYGGLGQNLFNPAMVAYVLLLVSFPVQMTSWLPPLQHRRLRHRLRRCGLGDLHRLQPRRLQHAAAQTGVDGLTMATPLDTLKTGLTQG